jgi:hypothetical protein
MQYFHFFGMLIAVTLFMMPPAATSSGMEGKDHIYLYDQYAFPPEKDGGVLLALTYVVPSHEAAKGIEAVIESVLKMVAVRQGPEKGVKEIMLHILLYPEGTILFCQLTIEEMNTLIHNRSINIRRNLRKVSIVRL